MGRNRFSVHVAAPRERVFALWTDLERMREWVGGVTGVTDVSSPIDRVGTTYYVRFGRMAIPTGNVEVDPPRRFATRFGNRLLRGRSSTTFEPDGDGTRVTQELETVGLISSIMGWIFSRGSYQGSLRGELGAFARFAERDAHSSTLPASPRDASR